VRSGQPRDLVIRAAWVVPMGGPPLAGGSVRLRGGRIVSVTAGPVRREHGEALLDLPDAVVIPGLVNAHTHLEFSDVSLPLDSTGGLPGWISRLIPLRRTRGVDAAGAAIRRGLDESAAHGVTAIGEISTGLPAGGYPTGGPRLRVFREALGLGPAAAEGAGRAAIRDLQRLMAAGVASGLSPHAPYSVTASLAGDILAAAHRLRVPLAMHVAESEAEAELLRTGRGAFRELFEQLGVWPAPRGPALLPAADWIARLARGPRGIVVHGTYLDQDPEAVARLARHRARLCVAICPRTTNAISGRLPPVRLLRDAGVQMAIGTDSRASTPDLSVLAECRAVVAAGLASPHDALRMATVHGAWALGFEKVSGLLAAGRPADLAVLIPSTTRGDPYDVILDPATRVLATLRSGRVIAGSLTARPSSP
jgi:cytosine/adenosine deaminase-related metal-dependent hydrolase